MGNFLQSNDLPVGAITYLLKPDGSIEQVIAAAAVPGSGISQLTQDVTAGPGTGSQAATVVGLQTRPVSATAPTTGQVLAWNGSAWAPATSSAGITQLTSDVTAGPGSGSQAATVVALQGHPVSISSLATADILAWNGSAFVNVIPTLTGDASSTSSVAGIIDATITGLQTHPVASSAPTTGAVLLWGGSSWGVSTVLGLSGDVSGNVDSNSSSVTVIGIQTHAVPAPSGTNTFLEWTGSAFTWAAAGGSGITQLTGDVTAGPGSGSVAASVVRIQGTAVSAATPTDGEVLGFSSGTSNWKPVRDQLQATVQACASGGTASISGQAEANFLMVDASVLNTTETVNLPASGTAVDGQVVCICLLSSAPGGSTVVPNVVLTPGTGNEMVDPNNPGAILTAGTATTLREAGQILWLKYVLTTIAPFTGPAWLEIV